MEKRAYNRITARIAARFFLGNVVCSGTVTNLSEKGMCVSTDTCPPCNSKIELLISSKKEVLSVPVRVKWTKSIMTGEFYDTMGVEILEPAKEYLEFANNFRREKEFSLDLQISKETLEQTTKCPNNFQCLTTENRDMCLIDRPVNGGGLFIKETANKYKDCPYMMSFVHVYICHCPTRYEIYQRYNI